MLTCHLAVLPARRDDDLRRSVLRAIGANAALLSVAAFSTLLSRTLELNGGAWSTLFADMGLALDVTHFGHVWLRRIPALVLLWLAWGWSMRKRHAPLAGWLMLLAVVTIALTRSQTGHPADHGDWALAVWIDWAHVLAAGAWVGSVFGMSLVVFPRLLRAGSAALEQSAQIFQRLSTVSGIALAVLLAAGLYNAVSQLGSFAALWTTRYGVILDIKLAIVLVMILIGAHNRYIKLPRLLHVAGLPVIASPRGGVSRRQRTGASADVVHVCARAVLLESLLGLAVIGVTAMLLHSMPPADMHVMHGADAVAPTYSATP
ncbi:MAG: CopD family protein [Burkholderiales bacterium]